MPVDPTKFLVVTFQLPIPGAKKPYAEAEVHQQVMSEVALFALGGQANIIGATRTQMKG